MYPICVGLIGYGYWGKILSKYLDESTFFDVKSIFGRSISCVGLYTNRLEDLLGITDVNSVVVATPISTHYEIVKKALEQNKHVFCEKPLTLRADEATELRDLAAEKHLSLVVDFTYTFSQVLELAQYYLASGRVGKLRRVEIQIKKIGVFASGDVRWTLGPHALSILNMFCPLDELSFSEASHIATGSSAESISIAFEGASVTGRVDLSMNYPAKQVEVVLYGEEGTIIYRPSGYEGWTLRLLRYPRSGIISTKTLLQSSVDVLTDESNNLSRAVKYFASVVNQKVPSNVEAATLVTAVLERLTQC